MSCLLCFRPGRKMNHKKNSDKKARRDKTSSSSPTVELETSQSLKPVISTTPAGAPASSETVQVSELCSSIALPAGAPASSATVQFSEYCSSVATPAGVPASSETVQFSDYRCQAFSYGELSTATNNFTDESLIGRGGFGTVYKGRIDTGENIAVKMLDKSGSQGDKEFLVELLMLSLLHHENLVHLYGYCVEGDQRLLVYEYMPLGSLEDHLFDLSDDQEALDWITRMKIARGAAKGLAYLHNEAKFPVIYRDMKISNILLDHEYKPKLSDFGLAKVGPSENMSHVSTRVMGTPGYCAPEYANTGKLTMKSDIYNFGVVLLELISGRKALLASGDSVGRSSYSIVDWAQSLFSEGEFEQIVDPMLLRKGGFSKTILKRTLEVAFMCLFEDANARPSISEVVNALDYFVENTSRNRNIRRGGGENVNEGEENGLERKIIVADARAWVEGQRTKLTTPSR